MEKTINTECREIYEGMCVEIKVNSKVLSESYNCKHLVGGRLKTIVVAYNECGYNTTSVCGQCILEILNNLK